MLHRADALYVTGRNEALLKLKPLDDAEATVIGHIPGKGKYEGKMGALQDETADGKRFQMIKFRSMRMDAELHGPGWTVQDDPRVTRSGRFMRRSNWDEIPQLINVLLGEMSLVGPRPERPVYVEKFQENFPRYMERHREKGGMTGWAQVNGLRGDTSIAERTALDLWYVENWSIWLDIKILTRTIWMSFKRNSKNAY